MPTPADPDITDADAIWLWAAKVRAVPLPSMQGTVLLPPPTAELPRIRGMWVFTTHTGIYCTHAMHRNREITPYEIRTLDMPQADLKDITHHVTMGDLSVCQDVSHHRLIVEGAKIEKIAKKTYIEGDLELWSELYDHLRDALWQVANDPHLSQHIAALDESYTSAIREARKASGRAQEVVQGRIGIPATHYTPAP